MSALRTLRNQIVQGRPPTTREKGQSRVVEVFRVTKRTCVGDHELGVPVLVPTQHETYYHPTKGRRWSRV